MRKQIVLSFFVFLAFNCFGQTTIYMQKEGGVYLVPCSVNGVKLKFIFDTGASDVSISSTEALFMLKNGYLTSKDFVGTQKYIDANGDISEGTKIILRKIEFAGLTLNNVQASIVNNLDAPLLLGQSAIAKLGKIQLEGNTLTIVNGKSKSDNNTIAKNSESCAKYKYSTYLANTLPEYMYLFTETTYTDKTKRAIELVEKATIYVLDEDTDNSLFFYVCYNGVKGYISRHLLIRED
jgi:clan AA aspartic protease (TIGR02281 family)